MNVFLHNYWNMKIFRQVGGYPKLPVTKKLVNGKAEDVCTTAECTLSASAILEAMDPTADPCEDFYQYACGGWINLNPIPDDASRWSQFNVLRVELSEALSSILQEPVNPSDQNPINQAKWLYAACMDDAALEAVGVTPLTDVLQNYGGWPLATSSWDSSSFDWQTVVAEGRRDFGYGNLIYSWVYADEKDTFSSALYIDQTWLGMPRSVLTTPEDYTDRIEAYKAYIKTTAQIIAASLGEVVSGIELDLQIENLLQFEMKLANITTAAEDRREIDRMYNPMTVSELYDLTSHYNNIDWLSILSTIFSGVGITIDGTTRVIVQELDYITQLSQLLQDTDISVVSNYLLWRYVQDLGDETTAAMRDASFQYDMVALGLVSQSPRTEVCADETNALLGFAVGLPYVQRYFSQQAKNDSNYLVEDLRTAFKQLLEVNEWMDDQTKPYALEKADAISKFIGYPDWYEELNGLDAYYQGLTVITETTGFFENIAAAR